MTKAKQSVSFYSLPEFVEWKDANDNWHTWKVKYYKGENQFWTSSFVTAFAPRSGNLYLSGGQGILL